ncbi:MAG: hypothetical protein KDA75_20500, partial [Planctomycetaceae bacterium]|nr:hypothetical protein [Planctomycetaceae bacterium]
GNSVSSPVGAPARTEAASVLNLSAGGGNELQQQLSRLQAAAASSVRQLDPPAVLSVEAPTDAVPATESSAPERRSYRLTP